MYIFLEEEGRRGVDDGDSEEFIGDVERKGKNGRREKGGRSEGSRSKCW